MLFISTSKICISVAIVSLAKINIRDSFSLIIKLIIPEAGVISYILHYTVCIAMSLLRLH